MLAQKIQQYSTVPDPSCAVCSVMDLTTEGHWFDPGSANFFKGPMIAFETKFISPLVLSIILVIVKGFNSLPQNPDF